MSKYYRHETQEKWCVPCQVWKPFSAFSLGGGAKRLLQLRCKECVKTNKRNHTLRTVEQRKQYNLKTRFGITIADFNAMLAQQNFCCAICTTPFVEKPENDGRGMTYVAHVDHDHATNKIRGLLCNLCNRGLGHFKDDTERLRNAIAYLEREYAMAVQTLAGVAQA